MELKEIPNPKTHFVRILSFFVSSTVSHSNKPKNANKNIRIDIGIKTFEIVNWNVFFSLTRWKERKEKEWRKAISLELMLVKITLGKKN